MERCMTCVGGSMIMDSMQSAGGGTRAFRTGDQHRASDKVQTNLTQEYFCFSNLRRRWQVSILSTCLAKPRGLGRFSGDWKNPP